MNFVPGQISGRPRKMSTRMFRKIVRLVKNTLGHEETITRTSGRRKHRGGVGVGVGVCVGGLWNRC